MSKVFGHEIGKELCAAFGLDPNQVVGLNVFTRAGELATVTIETYVQPKDRDNLKTELRKYRLVPIEDEDAEPATGS